LQLVERVKYRAESEAERDRLNIRTLGEEFSSTVSLDSSDSIEGNPDDSKVFSSDEKPSDGKSSSVSFDFCRTSLSFSEKNPLRRYVSIIRKLVVILYLHLTQKFSSSFYFAVS